MSDEVPAVIVTEPPILPPPTLPVADASKPPVWGPLMGLLGSQKALMMIIALVGAFVALMLDKINWVQFGIFAGPIIAIWIPSHAMQESAIAKAKAPPEAP